MQEYRLGSLGRELLRRIIERGLTERFSYLDLVSHGERMTYIITFHALVENELIERMHITCGVWHYRLTAAGRAALSEGITRPPAKLPPPRAFHAPRKGKRAEATR